MNLNPTQVKARQEQERRQREYEDSPIVYLRMGMLIRDPARAAAEPNADVREWSIPLSWIGLAAVVGSILGCLLR